MRSPYHVLVAEDEDLVAEALAELLRSYDYRVTVAHDGHDALSADSIDQADILVTDVRMPKMDGNELVSQIRQRRPALPIVVMTGYSDKLPREEVGRLILLRKPFVMGELVRAVGALLPAHT